MVVPANEIAESLGNKRMTNMVMLGALLANLPVLPLEAVEKALQEHLPERHHKLLPMNYQALREGAKHIAEKCKEQSRLKTGGRARRSFFICCLWSLYSLNSNFWIASTQFLTNSSGSIPSLETIIPVLFIPLTR